MLKPIFGRDFENDFKIKLKIIAKNGGSKFGLFPTSREKSGENPNENLNQNLIVRRTRLVNLLKPGALGQ